MRHKKTWTEPVPKYRYIAYFEPDLEDGGYTVTVPALPGCISQGDTLDHARFMIQDAIECYLGSLRKDGIEPPPSDAPEPTNTLEQVVEVSMT